MARESITIILRDAGDNAVPFEVRVRRLLKIAGRSLGFACSSVSAGPLPVSHAVDGPRPGASTPAPPAPATTYTRRTGSGRHGRRATSAVT